MPGINYDEAALVLRGVMFAFGAATLLVGFCLGDMVGRKCARREGNQMMESMLRLHRQVAQQHQESVTCHHDNGRAVAWDKGLEDRIKKILEVEIDDKGDDTFVIKTG